jgi:hypothetical protein
MKESSFFSSPLFGFEFRSREVKILPLTRNKA